MEGMPADLVLTNAKLLYGTELVEGGIAVDDGKITAVAREPHLPKAERVRDCNGMVVIPGAIDPHMHLGAVMGLASEIRTETRSAAKGGVTTIMTLLREHLIGGPYLDAYAQTVAITEANSTCDVAFHIGIQEERHSQELRRYFSELGSASFKFRMTYARNELLKTGAPPVDDGILLDRIVAIRELGPPAVAMIHCESADIVARSQKRILESKRDDLAAFEESRPLEAETHAILRAAYLSKVANCPLYLPHVTSREAMEIVRYYRSLGCRIYAETCPQYLTLTKDSSTGALGVVNPPLRGRDQMEALWEPVSNGLVDCIGTDHVTTLRAKKTSVFGVEIKGFPGVGTMLPVMISEGFHKRGIPLSRIVELCSYNTARIF